MASDETVGDYTEKIDKRDPRMKSWYFSLTKTGGLYIIVNSITPDFALQIKNSIYGKDYMYMFSEAEWKREIVRHYSIKLFRTFNINKEEN